MAATLVGAVSIAHANATATAGALIILHHSQLCQPTLPAGRQLSSVRLRLATSPPVLGGYYLTKVSKALGLHLVGFTARTTALDLCRFEKTRVAAFFGQPLAHMQTTT